MKKLVVIMAIAMVFTTITFAETDGTNYLAFKSNLVSTEIDGTNYSEQVVSKQYLLSDELPSMLFLTWSPSGVDETNNWFTIELVTTNGVEAVEVVAYYPSSWKVRSFQTSSDLSNSNNWSGLMPEEIILTDSAPYGELPRWTRWIVKRSNVGSRFFRLKTP